MSERFSVGLDMTTSPPSIYLIADGHHFYFTDARECGKLGVACNSMALHFTHPVILPELLKADDRQIVRLGK